MTMTDELMALADRVEALTEPCRETDKEIVLALYPDASVNLYHVDDDEPTVYHAEPLVRNKRALPTFTASLDAAMTLVPEGWCIRLNQTSDGERADNTSDEGLPDWTVAIIPHALTGYANRKKAWGGWLYGNAATPALALTAAALRAIAETLP
jgi:hypothetical protein